MGLKKSHIKFQWSPDVHEQYLKTHYWRNRKVAYFENNERKCLICPDQKYIHLHHRNYKNVWQESDTDLIPLCAQHHGELHALQDLCKLNEEEATIIYLTLNSDFENEKMNKKLTKLANVYINFKRAVEEEFNQGDDQAYEQLEKRWF